ncbi:MAG TPA: hypothetical protein VLP30_01870, partial [Desulfatirhabdiaceae bacterium]|nr:hypothetical protein [Desulfatirhabdiaceae bacterium]
FLTAAGNRLPDAVTSPIWVPYAGLGLALAGLVLAWMEFGRVNAPRIGFVERLPAVANFFRERWYLDHLYQKILERVVDNGLARLCAKNDDQVIDGAIHGLNSATISVSRMLGILQAGTIQSRLLIIFTVLVLLALYFFV